MAPRPHISKQRRTPITRIVLCGARVYISCTTMMWLGGLPGIRAAENTVSDPEDFTQPAKTQSKLVMNYGKLPISFEANRAQVSGASGIHRVAMVCVAL